MSETDKKEKAMTTDKPEQPDVLDSHIYEHLHRFGENNIFRASLDHFRETGKPSGSFRASLRAMLEEWSSPFNPGSKNWNVE